MYRREFPVENDLGCIDRDSGLIQIRPASMGLENRQLFLGVRGQEVTVGIEILNNGTIPFSTVGISLNINEKANGVEGAVFSQLKDK
jgi:hypothetical protein